MERVRKAQQERRAAEEAWKAQRRAEAVEAEELTQVAPPPRVRTTADFCDFLLRKAPGLEAGFLPVEGRNKVIFRRAAAPPQPERLLALPSLVYTPQSVGRANRKFRDGERASG